MYFLATTEGDQWLRFLLLPYFLWFHFVSSCIPATCHKIKLSAGRYSDERSGTPTQPPVWPEVSFRTRSWEEQWRGLGVLCVWEHGCVFHPYMFSSFQAERRGSHWLKPTTGHICGMPCRGRGGLGGEGGWENGWKESGSDFVAKNMNKWSSIPQIESNLMIGDYWNILLTWVLRWKINFWKKLSWCVRAWPVDGGYSSSWHGTQTPYRPLHPARLPASLCLSVPPPESSSFCLSISLG